MIEVTYCYKYSTGSYKKDVESVQVKPKGTRFKPAVKKAEVYNRDIDTSFRPGWMDAGITNSNLGGAKVMNALSIDPTADDFFLRELYNYG